MEHATLRVVLSEASRLAWRNRWLDPDDLKQEALATAFGVDERGLWRTREDPVAYMARAVRTRLMEMVMRAGCPVKVGIGSRTGGWSAAYDDMVRARGVSRCEDEEVGASDPEEALDRARALAAIREVMSTQSPAARAVVLDEQKPAEVAREMGLSVAQVYWQTEKARDAVKARLREMVGR